MSRRPASARQAEAPAAFGPVVLGRPVAASGGVLGTGEGVFTAPRQGVVVVVTAVGSAEGSRGAAAALSCVWSGVEKAALLVDVGGRVPRPTLIASASAHRLEERLAARLPALRPAARGEVCHLSVAADEDGLASAGVAVTVARGGLAVVHVAPDLLQPLLEAPGEPRPDAALLRADLAEARPLVALAVDDLLRRGLRVAVLKSRLGWVAERRAGFGALGSDSGGLPESLLRRLLDLDAKG
ncbi:MAG TPA: hypothetical protein VHZ54_08205 [Solirubrobacterales bacterium]|jgi:hypothetical protein|nr:hypothetical protein [Solirubrobacterales bacterium]